MTPATIRQLNQINQDFYRQTASHFSVTRSHPWDGWRHLIHPIAKLIKTIDRPVKILDLGCGNGRFASWLSQNWPTTPFEYHGVDFSEQLLKETQSLQLPLITLSTHQLNIVENVLTQQTVLAEDAFDVVVSFGVLHHIPSHQLRQRFLELCRRKLMPNGLGVVSLWQFTRLPHLLERKHDPTEFNLTELEPGDYLLDWQRGVSAVRYCHLITEAEGKQLATQSNLKVIQKFKADGPDQRTNLYFLLAKSTSR